MKQKNGTTTLWITFCVLILLMIMSFNSDIPLVTIGCCFTFGLIAACILSIILKKNKLNDFYNKNADTAAVAPSAANTGGIVSVITYWAPPVLIAIIMMGSIIGIGFFLYNR